jgi:hypothetical protein
MFYTVVLSTKLVQVRCCVMLCLVLMSKVIWFWKVIGWSVEAVCISGAMHLCVQLSGGYCAVDPWGKYARLCGCSVCCFTVLLGKCCLPFLEIVHLRCCLLTIVQVPVEISQMDVTWFNIHSHSVGSELLGCCCYIQMCTFVFAFIKRTDLWYFVRIWKSSPSCSLCALPL